MRTIDASELRPCMVFDGSVITKVHNDGERVHVVFEDGFTDNYAEDDRLAVEDTFDHEFRGNRFRVTTIGTVLYNDDGDYTHYYLVEFDPGTDERWILDANFWHEEFEQTHFPSTHCHHSYDCCGNFYAGQGYVGVVGHQVIVHQSWARNI